ncbi:hypothetical protein ACFPUW_15720 [Thalassorhabdus alkalitolerans]|uniref:hypothetical protein n=1 Tax=Thalassorhabdus alkalitolerans TaxID=2282697 RepID=UPI003620AF37
MIPILEVISKIGNIKSTVLLCEILLPLNRRTRTPYHVVAPLRIEIKIRNHENGVSPEAVPASK